MHYIKLLLCMKISVSTCWQQCRTIQSAIFFFVFCFCSIIVGVIIVCLVCNNSIDGVVVATDTAIVIHVAIVEVVIVTITVPFLLSLCVVLSHHFNSTGARDGLFFHFVRLKILFHLSNCWLR